jgi:hypothetical protein
MINRYFSKIENGITAFGNLIRSYSKQEKFYSENKGYIRGKVVFADDCGVSGYSDISMCYARLKVRALTLKRAKHFQSS